MIRSDPVQDRPAATRRLRNDMARYDTIINVVLSSLGFPSVRAHARIQTKKQVRMIRCAPHANGDRAPRSNKGRETREALLSENEALPRTLSRAQQPRIIARCCAGG